MKKTKKPDIITTRRALQELVVRLGCEPLVAVDLEADSMHHYQEKVCLIQISTSTESVIVDPLGLPDLSPLAPVMADADIRKIFHGADYDIRSLHRDFAIEVRNLFDTMIACQFLGEKEVGLAAVLFKRFGAELDKRHQKADWSRRPLPDDMIEYAIRDTSLLIPLYGQLKKELNENGRLAWVEEESELLAGVRANPRDQEPMFLRFKGAARMEQRSLAVLEELLRYRDGVARAHDLPPFKVMGSDAVRVLAERMPRRPADLEGIPGLTPKLIKRYGNDILEATARGAALPPERLPSYPSPRRYVKERMKGDVLKRLKLWREAKAEELGMEAGILVNNAVLEAVAEAVLRGKNVGEVISLKQWQNEAFGQGLSKFAKDLMCSS
ncbi:MAG TPA: HRDC domain-containing protein [Geobacteraceae bacterium]|nr:HRDC domain-containing protein [Geobacteraceae bacterium]